MLERFANARTRGERADSADWLAPVRRARADWTRLLKVALLVGLAAAMTLTSQFWVGNATIYSEALEPQRARQHEIILRNQLPPGQTWDGIGANGTNIRVTTVYLADIVHRVTGLSLTLTYVLIDTLAIFLTLIATFVLLKHWLPPSYALLGLLYVGVILPLTYFLYWFHPWDRVSLLAWVVCILLLRSQRLLLFSITLALAVTIKYDIVLLPGLYFLAFSSRANWQRTALLTTAFFAIAFGVYFGLRVLRPGGFDRTVGLLEQVLRNLRVFRQEPLAYPPLLALALPLCAGLVGLVYADRFVRACFGFGVLLLGALFLVSNFDELRALMPVLLLILPAALAGVHYLIEGTPPNVLTWPVAAQARVGNTESGKPAA